MGEIPHFFKVNGALPLGISLEAGSGTPERPTPEAHEISRASPPPRTCPPHLSKCILLEGIPHTFKPLPRRVRRGE